MSRRDRVALFPASPGSKDGGSTPEWFAVILAPNRQFRIRSWLRDRGFEEFLPTWHETVRWSDRSKQVERSLFPGYIFVRIERWQRAEIESAAGVVGFVTVAGRPAAIDADEIENLRGVLERARVQPEPCPHVAVPGETVEVLRGPLAGSRGTVVRTKGGIRLIVSIEILRRAVSVEIDAADVAKAA